MTDEHDEQPIESTKGEPLFVRKNVPAFETKGVNDDDRTIEAVVSTNIVDRDGEIVEPKAFKGRLGTFLKNPVMLWNHDPFQPPIGKAVKLDILDDRIEATFQFRPKGENALADDVFSAFKGGFLSSFSIGFRVFEVTEGKDAKTGNALPPRITDAELFEVSAVTIPANTDAVVRADRMLRTVKSALYGGHIEAKTVYSAPTDCDVLERAALILSERKDALTDQETKALEKLALAVFCNELRNAPEPEPEINKELAEAVQGLRAELAEATR